MSDRRNEQINEPTDRRTHELINELITLPAVYPGSVPIRSFFSDEIDEELMSDKRNKLFSLVTFQCLSTCYRGGGGTLTVGHIRVGRGVGVLPSVIATI